MWMLRWITTLPPPARIFESAPEQFLISPAAPASPRGDWPTEARRGNRLHGPRAGLESRDMRLPCALIGQRQRLSPSTLSRADLPWRSDRYATLDTSHSAIHILTGCQCVSVSVSGCGCMRACPASCVAALFAALQALHPQAGCGIRLIPDGHPLIGLRRSLIRTRNPASTSLSRQEPSAYITTERRTMRPMHSPLAPVDSSVHSPS